MGLRASVHERAGVTWIFEHAQCSRVHKRAPREFTLMRPRADTPWEQQALICERAYCARRRAGALERLEKGQDRSLDLEVRVEDHLASRVIHEPDRQFHLQLAAAGFGALASNQARTQDAELGFAHRALQTEKQAIVKVSGVDDHDAVDRPDR